MWWVRALGVRQTCRALSKRCSWNAYGTREISSGLGKTLETRGKHLESKFSAPEKLNANNSSRIWAWGGAGAFAVASSLAVISSEESKEAEQIVLEKVPEKVTLYQYEVCPFCNKVKAYLDFHKIPYETVEVDPLLKKEIKGLKFKKVPIVQFEDKGEMNDSDEIINTIEKAVEKSKPKKWFSKANATEEQDMWRHWVNKKYVHILTVNIYQNVGESFETFDYITTHGNFNFFTRDAARFSGASLMYVVSKRIKKRHNIENERESLYTATEEWVQGLKGRKFLGGDEPNLADLSVFGVIRAIKGTTTFKDMMKNTSIKPWYEVMAEKVGESSRINKVAWG